MFIDVYGSDEHARQLDAALYARFLDAAEAVADYAIERGATPPGTTALGTCPDGDTACLRAQLSAIATALWSSTPTPTSLDVLLQVTADGLADGDPFAVAARDALVATLAAPQALLVELPGGSERAAVAERLSRRLWSRPPDAVLLARVTDADRSGEALRTLVSAMLDDRRSDAFFEDLADRYFYAGAVTDPRVDLADFPTFDAAARRAAREEPVRLMRAFLAENLPARHLIDADFTVVDGPLARHYGLESPQDGPWLRTSLEGAHRRGLGQTAAFLATSSQWNRTGVPARANWLLIRLLCDVPPFPPASATNTNRDPTATKREWFAVHRARPDCQACHENLDPYGFAQEEFGRAGEYRTADEFQQPPEPADTIAGRSWTDGEGFAAFLADDPRFLACLPRRISEAGVPEHGAPPAVPELELATDVTFRDVLVRTIAAQEEAFAGGGLP